MRPRLRRPTPAAALLLAAALAGCTGSLSTGSAGDGRSGSPPPAAASRVENAKTELAVQEALLAKLGRGAADVNVHAEGSRVFLTGLVDDRSTQELAEEVALSVRGVTRVTNWVELEEAPPPNTPAARAVADAEREIQDAVLEARVKRRLLEEIGRHALAVEVEATAGKVSLRGRLPDEARKRLALETARGVRGVREVVDLLET